jgi:predicted Zn-ribbon and HTH transcriptional regulator
VPDLNTTAGDVGWEHAPSHYQGAGGLENFDVWDAYEMDPYTANAFKYLARHDKKGSAFNDLKKAAHYLEEAILRMEEARLDLRPARVREQRLHVQNVIDAFGLTGNAATAVFHLLYAKIGKTPYEDIRAAKRYADRAVKEAEGV